MDNRFLRVLLILMPIAVAISTAALFFVIMVIIRPDWEWVKNFPLVRETVSALSTAAMVVATLFLAWGTFSVIHSDRQREERDRKERLLNEISEWATKGYELFYDMQKYVYEISERTELEKALTILWAEKAAMVVAAKDVDLELSQSVDLVKNKLDSYWKNKGSWKPECIKTAENELEGLFAELSEKAARTKTKLKL